MSYTVAMAAILTLAHYKAVRSLATNPEKDNAITAAIPAAEQTILEYTNRDLTSDPAEDTRLYPYEPGARIVNIDDALSVSSVKLNERSLAPAVEFRAGTAPGEPVISWLELVPNVSLVSPIFEVTHVVTTQSFTGFMDVEVTGVFGWPEIPATAVQAAVWLVDEMIAPGADTTGHAAESIADLSFVNRGEEPIYPSGRLPTRVAQILSGLRRVAI